MFKRAACVIALILVLPACRAAEQNPAASATAPVADTTRPKREKILCSDHYAQVREAILGTLRGTESLPLIQVATRVSSAVLNDTALRFNADCGFDNRQFQKLRIPTVSSVTPLQGHCAALIDKIDARCLKPFVERGEPLDKTCHVVLIGIAHHEQTELMRRMRNDDFCASVQDGL